MGASLHLVVQKREHSAMPWELVQVRWQCPWCKERGADGHRHLCSSCRGAGWITNYELQCYKVFGQLAGVREERWPIVACRRGLPRGWDRSTAPDVGEHSHSWVLLAELLAYDQEQTRVVTAFVEPDTFDEWDRVSPPKEYSRWVSGPKLTVERYLEGPALSDWERWHSHIEVSWVETARQHTWGFWEHFVPVLVGLGRPEHVRLVFGFKS